MVSLSLSLSLSLSIYIYNIRRNLGENVNEKCQKVVELSGQITSMCNGFKNHLKECTMLLFNQLFKYLEIMQSTCLAMIVFVMFDVVKHV